ncbi:MAG: hypothetical protein QME90_10960 [Thermodesulfobacteriota bacterium]|nr:hypothetical protein [Thermodesulfobacteriota bacterium]
MKGFLNSSLKSSDFKYNNRNWGQPLTLDKSIFKNGETFRVLKEKEEREYGECRTKPLVLEAWDRSVDSGASIKKLGTLPDFNKSNGWGALIKRYLKFGARHR